MTLGAICLQAGDVVAEIGGSSVRGLPFARVAGGPAPPALQREGARVQ